ncbi:Holliday junction resolvase RuvX [Halothermothrix orenii]|uniref:Putative pre-16S rRNA nuclease n=1 Tax=Halothermothrix orenii (strain H 168 / OCM 544 / DSM 9562) TaxID=373903 RepID=YQGF_HALOH|nr:Holliday junction resolvase RuvX [Halothermothrix orenii]B8D2B0.1 RecName: Full=Putative pre-16S rRNA nuclease [Halothermothrix orenii H 168]ACL69337.1 Holliday junction resolvase YqgF [Halothermothrix orenii H 168]
MRIMGLDYGDRRIGVAISDKLGMTAQGQEVIIRKTPEEDLEVIKGLIDKYEVEEIIVGMPKNMDGSLGPRAEKTRDFIDFLQKSLDTPVKVWDERLSTVEAERVLIEADVSRKKRKGVIDKVAASIILQGYLNYQNKLHG